MKRIDTHTHTSFSPDSTLTPKERFKHAEGRLDFLALTDHMDIGASYFPDAVINYMLYFQMLEFLRKNCSFNTAIGIECGYTKESVDANLEIINKFPFEYIINSVHIVAGGDCYFEAYFDGKDKKQAYNDYFEAVLDSLDVPYDYDAVGHIGYVTRNAPYTDKSISQADSGEIIDGILKGIIKRDKILEVNANIRTDSPHTPGAWILKRYRELGGELITYGSDAHNTGKLLQDYKTVTQSIKECGFKYLFAKKGKDIVSVKIED